MLSTWCSNSSTRLAGLCDELVVMVPILLPSVSHPLLPAPPVLEIILRSWIGLNSKRRDAEDAGGTGLLGCEMGKQIEEKSDKVEQTETKKTSAIVSGNKRDCPSHQRLVKSLRFALYAGGTIGPAHSPEQSSSRTVILSR